VLLRYHESGTKNYKQDGAHLPHWQEPPIQCFSLEETELRAERMPERFVYEDNLENALSLVETGCWRQ
jgi:hypothetical protein